MYQNLIALGRMVMALSHRFLALLPCVFPISLSVYSYRDQVLSS